MRALLNAIKLVYAEGKFKAISLLTFIAVIALYLVAVEQSVSFDTFLKVNSVGFIVAQLILSLVNAIFASIAITFTIYIFRQQKLAGGLSSIQSVASLFVAVGTTGCYVCGTLLLPIVGISSAFAGLPFAGLEIKVITLALFIISIWEMTPRVLGTCNLTKLYKVNFGRKVIAVNNNFLRNFRFISLSIFFISLIFILPAIIPKSVQSGINQNGYFCEVKGG